MVSEVHLGKKCSNISGHLPFLNTKMCCDAGHLLVAPSAISEQLKIHGMQNWKHEESLESQKSVDHENIFLSLRE